MNSPRRDLLGGLEELKTNLSEGDIRFAVLECVVTGDHYNSVKFVLISWIGANVGAGLAKAKAAGHRKELVVFLTESLAIAAEFQVQSLDELTSKDISAALTKRAATYQDSTAVAEKRQVMSRSHAATGDRSKSQLTIIDEDRIAESLREVHAGKLDWVHISYAPGTKDQVTLVGSGKGGLEGLKPQLASNCISFCVVTFQIPETTNVMTKYVLLTWVPEATPPLQKARSGAHRSELADWIIVSPWPTLAPR